MLAKGLRTHSLYNCSVYVLSCIKIVHKPWNVTVQVKDDCRLLIKATVFIEHLTVKEILIYVLYNKWKTFSLCIGRAQSIHCAMMQHMTAVGHRSVRPTPTNTCLVNRPIECDVGYSWGPVTKKRWFFLPMEPTIQGGCLLSFRLALCYCPCSCSK
jgi:hypothetical protein